MTRRGVDPRITGVPHRNAATVIACASALLIPGPAQAAGGPSKLLFEREFVVTLSAKVDTVFDQPKRYGAQNCSGKEWTMVHEEEHWSFASRQRVGRLGAVDLGNGSVSFLRTDVDDLGSGVPAGGSITRDQRITTGKEGGECGGGRPAAVDVGDDCGTKMVDYQVALELVAGKLAVKPHPDPEAPSDQGVFFDCGLMYPQRAVGGGWSYVQARVDRKAFWHGTKPLRLKASKTFTERPFETTPALSLTKTSWTVTLKPVLGKHAGRKPRRR
jgi:hypothetical protein